MVSPLLTFPFTFDAPAVTSAVQPLYSTLQFRMVVQTADGNLYYPKVLSGSSTFGYPFTVPTARFVVSTNSSISTSTYLSPIRNDDIARFQVNHKYHSNEKDVWVDVFEGRIRGISAVLNDTGNNTTIKCIGHEESLKYTQTPATVSHTAKTTGFILETLMSSMARISNSDTLLDIAGSTSISQFDLKADSQKIMDVIRDLEGLELYGYIFKLRPVYDSGGLLTSVEPIWEAISSTATNIYVVNENAQSFLSASFGSDITRMRNRVTIYGSDTPQVSAMVEDAALQTTYDIRTLVEVDKTIATAAMCTNIATSLLSRWKNPIISGTATIRGNPYVKVGDRVYCKIPSLVINGESIDGNYLVYGVTHNIGDGFTTTLLLGEIDMTASEIITSFVLGNRRNNLNGID